MRPGARAGKEKQTRLPREQRREHLLAAALEIVAESGPESLTMEGLAARAGVSKALPYQHFEDSEDVLVALTVREATLIGEVVGGAFGAEAPLADGIRRSLFAYFDLVAERGMVMSSLVQYRYSPVRQEIVNGAWAGTAQFYAARFRVEYGLPSRMCLAAAYAYMTAVAGAQPTWVRGLVPRRDVEEMLFHLVVDGLAGLAAATPTRGRQPR